MRDKTNTYMLKIPKNRFVVTYLSFVGGFLMIFVAQLASAINEPEDPPLTVGGDLMPPVVHSMDIAGGFTDADLNGVSINNDGKLEVKTRTLTGSYTSPNYGLNITSAKGGLYVTSPYNPAAGRNDVRLVKNAPSEYGRVGVEGRVVGNAAGIPDITKGFLGYVQHGSIAAMYTEYEPLPAIVPSALIPYAFYTVGATYLGDMVTINGAIKNVGSGVTVAGDSFVAGNVDVDGDLETDVLNFSGVTNLDARFVIGDLDATWAPSVSTSSSNGAIFNSSRSCAPDAYLVGCTGYVTGANSYAPYRGAKMTSTSNKGGRCTAYAKSLGNSPSFNLYAVPYCFNPH